ILVMIGISKTPSLCPAVKFPKDPVILVICPTNFIEQQMADNMEKLGVPALIINSDTVAIAQIHSEDLFIKACAGIAMLILGPEQLISEGFRMLLAFQPFYDRVCALGVDEIHLLVYWGLAFCKAFLQIGYMRARFRPRIPIIGLTATPHRSQGRECNFLSLGCKPRGNSSDPSLKCPLRQILFRQLYSGIEGKLFPEIAWVLRTTHKTLIFGNTVPLVFQLKSYLNSLLPTDSNHDSQIRTHTGINWPDDKIKTLSDIVNESECQIVIATAGLAQGNDIKVIKTVIQIGEPESIEMCVQKAGCARPGADKPQAIFYISSHRMELAAKIGDQTDAENEADVKKAGGSAPRKSRPTAAFLTAKCKPTEQDRQFNNPTTDSPCPCKTCTTSPPTLHPEHCACSGCMPD
ncbi:P-loop containing nucleoside triphosphate hydrolase protein, partial [Mycena epipterygia]